MWVAKLKVFDSDGLFASLAMKYSCKLHGYMLGYYSNKRFYYYTLTVYFDGKKESRKAFITDLQKSSRIHQLEDQESVIICRLRIPLSKEKIKKPSLFYDPQLIQLKPFIITPDGWETLEFASFERKNLERVIKIAEKKYHLSLSHFRKENISNLGVLNVLPNLTKKQDETLTLAIKNGYYEYPRKTDVKKLAKQTKTSYSNFQEHLRKAENKLIPYALERSKQ